MYYYNVAIIAVSGQECTGVVGSLSHDGNIVTPGHTYILAGYTVPCNRTVVAWEFCYQILNSSVTFYPGIWRITGTTDSNIDYELIQLSNVTYDLSTQISGIDLCQKVNLSTTDQFTAPAGSVVGLYSNVGTQLLRTNNDSSITTYQFSGNQSSVRNTGDNVDINYNIAIRVHLGKVYRIQSDCLYIYVYIYISEEISLTYRIFSNFSSDPYYEPLLWLIFELNSLL